MHFKFNMASPISHSSSAVFIIAIIPVDEEQRLLLYYIITLTIIGFQTSLDRVCVEKCPALEIAFSLRRFARRPLVGWLAQVIIRLHLQAPANTPSVPKTSNSC